MKNLLPLLVCVFSYQVMAENLSIPDINQVSKVVKKNLSASTEEYCATCAKNPDSRSMLFEKFKKMGGDPTALTQALCFLDKHKETKFVAKGDSSRADGIQIQNQRYITIEDLVQSSKQPRLFVIDLKTGEVEATFSAHGGGQKILGDHIASKDVAPDFSNKEHSNLSARGFFITGSRYVSGSGQWKFGMRLHGIQSGINDNTFTRVIVMHPYPGVEDKLISSNEPNTSVETAKADQGMPLSWGCTMLSPKYASDVVDKIKASSTKEGGSLYYNYTSTEKNYGDKYCGDENLLVKH